MSDSEVRQHLRHALPNEPLTLHGDGKQTRSFCYVVDGVIRLMDSEDALTGPVNLGNPNEVTMLELAELVLELTHSRSRIEHAPLPHDDPRQRRPDIARAAKSLGWKPVTPLRAGLEKTIAYFDELLRRTGSVARSMS